MISPSDDSSVSERSILDPSTIRRAQRDERIEELLDRWEIARERGVDLSADMLCVNDPELLPIIRARVEKLARLETYLRDSARENLPDPILDDDDPTLGVAWGVRLIRLIAEGGLGRVYLAKDLQIERLLAVKFLRPERRHDPEQVERFLVEAQITGALGHPGIVPILGIGTSHDNLPFYVMPLIEGPSLADAIDDFHLAHTDESYYRHADFRRLLNSFITVCQTIAYAHRHKVLHRDIKPQNVILGSFGETILIDWGLATLLPQSQTPSTESEKRLLASTLRVRRRISAKEGTLPYMSPELHLGLEDHHPSSDVYALGVTLFRIMTGVLPIDVDHRDELVHRIIAGEYRVASDAKPGCPAPLAAIASQAMSISASERFKSAAELAQAVSDCMDAHCGDDSRNDSGFWSFLKRRRHER